MEKKRQKRSLLKVILTDLAGIGCLLLVPFLGPLPGPGGIPLILAGVGLLATNHDWADNAIHYVKKHSTSLQSLLFPNKTLIKWLWDVLAITGLILGWWMNASASRAIYTALSISIFATASTIFMLNRNRITWLDQQVKRIGKK